MTLIAGPDRYIYGVDLTGQYKIAWDEDTDDDGTYETTETLSLTEEVKYGHADTSLSSLSGGAHKPLFQDLVDAANNNSNLANSYVVEAITPSGGSIPASAIRIKSDGVTDYPFRISLGTGSQMAPEWLGFDTDGFIASSDSGGREVIDAPYTARTFWQPLTYFSDDRATEKGFDETVELGRTSDDESTADQIQHGPAREMRQPLTYEWVPAAAVRDAKADYSGQADNADVPTGDVGVAMYWMWRSARQNRPVILVHNEGQSDLTVDNHDYEVGFLRTEDRTPFSTVYEQRKKAPEIYDLELGLQITGEGNLGVR